MERKYVKGMFSILLLIILISGNSILAQGKFIFVKWNAAGANDGSSWQNAFTNLQDAFDISDKGDTIFVSEGTYYPDRGANVTRGDRFATFTIKEGIVVVGGYRGNEYFTKTNMNYNKYWRNWRKNKTIISGDLLNNDNDNIAFDEPTRSDNSYHIFLTEVSNDSTTAIDGFYIEGGNASRTNLRESAGGAVYLGNSHTLIINCVFRNNSARETGGAIFAPAGIPKIKYVTFINNRAKNGGAVFFTGNDHLNLPTRGYLTNSYFYNNHADENGGGFYAGLGVNPLIMNCAFVENTAVMGAGAYADPRSYPHISNCTFFKNAATTAGGGTSLCAGTIMNAIFRENTAPASSQINIEREPDYPSNRIFKNSIVQGGFEGSHVFDSDPRFVNPDNPAGEDSLFGTSDDGLIIPATSSAVNTGIAYLYEYSDIRGYPRQSHNIPDLGAYETQKLPVDYETIYESLKEGGYILVYRHGKTDWRTTDQPGFTSDLENCSLQRNLSEEGRKQVRYLGDVLKLLNIPVDTAISSPACRCVETGEAISGNTILKYEWLLDDSASRAPKIEDLNRLTRQGVNSVISTHMNVIEGVTSFPRGEVNEGDAVIIRPLGDSFEEIGQISTDTWERIIELLPNDGTVGVEEKTMPADFVLYDSYPNPFNPVTTIKFAIPATQHVSLKVYDSIGKLISELVNGYKSAGDHEIKFNAVNISSGVYFYTLNAGGFSKTKKLVVVK